MVDLLSKEAKDNVESVTINVELVSIWLFFQPIRGDNNILVGTQNEAIHVQNEATCLLKLFKLAKQKVLALLTLILIIVLDSFKTETQNQN